MATALGSNLVFDLDAVRAGAFENAHGMANVQRVAKSSVSIDDQRQVHGITDASRVIGDVSQTHKALVRHAEPHIGHASAGNVEGLETEVGDHFCRERVEGAWHQDAAAGFSQGLEILASGHVRIFLKFLEAVARYSDEALHEDSGTSAHQGCSDLPSPFDLVRLSTDA